MEDLSALSRALKEASDRTGRYLFSSAYDRLILAVEGSFISLIERYLRSSDIGIRIATAETLQEIISGADEESKVNQQHRSLRIRLTDSYACWGIQLFIS